MNLDDWIKNLFPLPKKIKWHEIFGNPSSPFILESSERLSNLLESCNSVEGIAKELPKFLPILLSSGTPEIAITQLLDFSSSFQKKNGTNFKWSHPEAKSLIHIF